MFSQPFSVLRDDFKKPARARSAAAFPPIADRCSSSAASNEAPLKSSCARKNSSRIMQTGCPILQPGKQSTEPLAATETHLPYKIGRRSSSATRTYRAEEKSCSDRVTRSFPLTGSGLLALKTCSRGVARCQPRHLSVLADFERLSHAVVTIQRNWRLRQRRATRAAKMRFIYSVARNSRQRCSSLSERTGRWTNRDLQTRLEKDSARAVIEDVSKAAHSVVAADRFVGYVQQQAVKHRRLKEKLRKQRPKLQSIMAMDTVLEDVRTAQNAWMVLLSIIKTP